MQEQSTEKHSDFDYLHRHAIKRYAFIYDIFGFHKRKYDYVDLEIYYIKEKCKSVWYRHLNKTHDMLFIEFEAYMFYFPCIIIDESGHYKVPKYSCEHNPKK